MREASLVSTLVAAKPSALLVACDTGLALLRVLRRAGDVEEREAAQEAIDEMLDARLTAMGVELVGEKP